MFCKSIHPGLLPDPDQGHHRPEAVFAPGATAEADQGIACTVYLYAAM